MRRAHSHRSPSLPEARRVGRLGTLGVTARLELCSEAAAAGRAGQEDPHNWRRAGGVGGWVRADTGRPRRSEEHTSELQSQSNLLWRLLLEKKKNTQTFNALT